MNFQLRCKTFYFLFVGKTWPIFLGAGTGLGMGIANCQHEFKDPYNFRVKVCTTSNLSMFYM